MPETKLLAWHEYYADYSGIPRFHPLYFLAVRRIRRILATFAGTEFDLESRFLAKQDEMCEAFKVWLAENKDNWDLLIQAPSSAPYAAAFADAASSVVASRINLRSEGKRKAGDSQTSKDDILREILPLDQDERALVVQAKEVLVVDDVYARGNTTRAVECFLRQQGLPVESTVTVAVPLRVHGTT
jgi:predicted amidophosphoribosyltransferase